MFNSIVFTSNTSWFLYNFRGSTIRAMVERGCRVICLAPEDEFSRRLVYELGAQFVPIPLKGKSIGFINELKSIAVIFKVMRRIDPEMVFNSTIKMNIYGGIVCQFLRVPFVNNVSGLGTAFIHDSALFRCVRWLYGKVNQRARHLFFENEDDLEVFGGCGLLGGTPVTILPGSGVDLERFRASPLPQYGPVTFLMIARLLGDKGIREYARASQLLRRAGWDLRCLLVGPLGVSNRTAVSEEEISHWQNEGFLEYLGSTDDVRPLIELTHVLVLPSYREGMPRTVLEAAAMGRPAIVTDVPGCRHAIDPEVTGWLCEARSASSLAEQMRRVAAMDPAELQIAGDEARRRMEEQFGEERVVQAYLDCLPV